MSKPVIDVVVLVADMEPALKRDLARCHAGGREAYAKGKDAFIDAVVRAAGGLELRPFWKA